MNARTYRNAVDALRPNRKAMEEINRAYAAATRKASDEVRAMLEAGGDARALYEAETDRHRRVALLGVLRRGLSALD